MILNLRNQTLKNIEIILTFTKTEFKEYKRLQSLCLSDKRIKLKKTKRKDSISILFSLMNLLKGKFVLIINKYFNFKNNDLKEFYNFTKGKIKNIFEFKFYISFYLLISKDFIQKNIAFLKSLYDQYDYFNITILKIDNRYDKAFISRYITKETYFRCSLGELIPHLNKIIYLDNDVIVFKDLTNLYNMNFNDKMLLGQAVYFDNSSEIGFYKINVGIILLNLKKMRDIKMEKKILNIVINKREKYYFHDQSIINKYFRAYLGNFPPENHARPINYSQSIQFNNNSGNLYNIDYFLFSWKYPTIRHYLGGNKPFLLDINDKILEDWWFFARLSEYFQTKTKNLYKIFNYTILD